MLLSTSETSEEMTADEHRELWCTLRGRASPAAGRLSPAGPGLTLMEVVYHDECAYKQNDGDKGATMNPTNEGAVVIRRRAWAAGHPHHRVLLHKRARAN